MGKWYEEKEELYDFLKAQGVTEVGCTFSGGGDSGDIDDIELTIQQENGTTSVYTVYGKTADSLPTFKETKIKTVLEGFMNEVLEKSEHDWYNNEGGYGTATIKIEERKVYVDMNIAHTEYTNYEEAY